MPATSGADTAALAACSEPVPPPSTPLSDMTGVDVFEARVAVVAHRFGESGAFFEVAFDVRRTEVAAYVAGDAGAKISVAFKDKRHGLYVRVPSSASQEMPSRTEGVPSLSMRCFEIDVGENTVMRVQCLRKRWVAAYSVWVLVWALDVPPLFDLAPTSPL